MIVQWNCECGATNDVNLGQWKKVKHGQGFKAECENCEAEVDVDIEVRITQ
jgi:hypothetical protein